MGCVHTKPSVVKVAPSEDPIEQFFSDLIIEREYPLDDDVGEEALSPLLTKLKHRVTLTLTKSDDRASTAAYLNKVLDSGDFQLFDTIAEIIVRSQQIWHLNDQSLRFFHDLRIKNTAIFNGLIERLRLLRERNSIGLQAAHIDAVVDGLIKQMRLPEKTPAILDAFALQKQRTLDRSIQSLRSLHGPKIDIAATRLDLLHHANPHALEIRVRTMHMVQELQLFGAGTPRDHFLRTIIAFMVEFHDFIQGAEKGKYPSAEIATAETIIGWLKSSLYLNAKPELIKVLEFMASQIIILGTTIVFGRMAIDLSTLYFMLEEAAISADFLVVEPSYLEFKQSMNAVMLFAGICDKLPSVFGPVATLQSSPNIAALGMIKQHKPDVPLVLEEFFETHLVPYVDGADAPSPIDHQRFLMGVPPHMAMRAELSKRDKLDDVRAFMTFVRDCRKKLFEDDLFGFNVWFTEQCEMRQMVSVISNLFFSALDGEAAFCRSQSEGIMFARTKLEALLPARVFSFIDVEAVENEARNIEAFRAFVDGLEARPDAKKALVEELLLVVAQQAGTRYAVDPTLSYSTPSSVGPGFSLLRHLSLRGISNKRPSVVLALSNGTPTPLSSTTSTAMTVTPLTHSEVGASPHLFGGLFYQRQRVVLPGYVEDTGSGLAGGVSATSFPPGS